MKPTDRNEIKRYKERASYDENNLKNLLSKVLFCNVSFCDDEQPFIIPMNFVFLNNKIYLHGSPESRIMKEFSKNKKVVISFVYVENVVKSDFLCKYSMNYSSAVIFGKTMEVSDNDEKLNFFKELGKKVDPINFNNLKLPTENDLNKVWVIAVEIEEFSLKSRIGY